MSLARDITTVGSGTLISRLLAYLRDAGIAALLGAGPFSEAFFAVLQVINFFRRLLADGALNSAFIPIWLKLRAGADGEAKANRFTIGAIAMAGTITGIIVLGASVGAPYIVAVIAPGFSSGQRELASVLLMGAAPYIVMAGLVAVAAAALNAQGRGLAVAVSTVMFNLVMLLALAILAREPEQLWISFWLAIAVVIAGFVQFVVTAGALARGWRWQRTRERSLDQMGVFAKRAVPGLIAAGIPQLKLIAAAAIVSASPAAVSWLYYANRLYELPLGVASIAVAAVIVPRMAASLHSEDGAAYAAAQSRAYEIALGLALPAATGFALLAAQIAGGLFEHGAFGPHDTAAVAGALAAICAGLPGHVLEKVFGAVSFAHGDTHTPMLAALCGLVAAVAGGLLLFPRYGHVGAAAAIAISGWFGATILGIILYRRRWLRLDGDAKRRLPRIVLATAVMAAIVAYGLVSAQTLFPAAAITSLGRLAILAVLVTLGVVIYAAALHLLGVAKFKDLLAAMRG